MKPQLHLVKVVAEHYAIVVVEDIYQIDPERDPLKIAAANLRDITCHDPDRVEFVSSTPINSISDVPEDWRGALPFGGNMDLTVEEWLEDHEHWNES